VSRLLKINKHRFWQSVAVATMQWQPLSQSFRLRSACDAQIENNNLNSCKWRWRFNLEVLRNKVRTKSVLWLPICFLWLQGLARDWSKQNEHSEKYFQCSWFLSLSVELKRLTWNYYYNCHHRIFLNCSVKPMVCNMDSFTTCLMDISSENIKYCAKVKSHLGLDKKL